MSRITDLIKKFKENTKQGSLEKEFDLVLKQIKSIADLRHEIEDIAPHRHFKLDEIENFVLDKIQNDKELFAYQDYLGMNLGMYACEYKLDKVVKEYINDPVVNRQRDGGGSTIGRYVMRCDRKDDLLKQVIDNKISIFTGNYSYTSVGMMSVQNRIYEQVIKRSFPDFDMYEYEKQVAEFEGENIDDDTDEQVSTCIDDDIDLGKFLNR